MRFIWILLVLLPLFAGAQNLRDKLGTRSSACATALSEAMQASSSKQHATALQQIRLALKHDPGCELAHYWHAIILMGQGDADGSIAVYEAMIRSAMGKREGTLSNVPIDAALNLGLTHGRLGDLAASSYWLSQAILMDMDNTHNMQWKAYRNMAINSSQMGDSMSALIQAMKARELAPSRVSDAMIKELAGAARDTHPTLRLLTLSDSDASSSTQAVRKQAPALRRSAEIEGKIDQTKALACILVHPKGYLYLFHNGEPTCDIVDPRSATVKRLTLPHAVSCAAAYGDQLLVARPNTSSLDLLALNGSLQKSFTLGAVPSSIAVCPRTQQAFVAAGSMVRVLSLLDGTVTDTDVMGQLVTLDVPHQILYATYKPPYRDTSRTMLVNGRPIFFSSMGDVFADQNAIFKAAYKADGHVVLAAIRTQAASNGFTMDLGGNGQRITVTGGGGYRAAGGAGGYGTGVLSCSDLNLLEGFYPTAAYSQCARFSPAGTQIAVIASKELKLFNLGDSATPASDKGEFGRLASWSANGSYLFVANKGAGVRVYHNTLTQDEVAAARQRPSMHVPRGVQATPSPTPQPQPWLRQFSPSSDMNRATAKARKALNEGGTLALESWRDSPLYRGPDNPSQQVLDALSGIEANSVGITIYKLKKVLKAEPNYAPAHAALGKAYSANGQESEAQSQWLMAIRTDAGRSSISSSCLAALGNSFLRAHKEPMALDCFAAGLTLDRDHEETLRLAKPLLGGHTSTAPTGTATLPSQGAGLSFPKHRAAKAALPPSKVFAVAATRTVLIKTDQGTGSGVCITDNGHVLTCSHVIPTRTSSIDVTMFKYVAGRAIKDGESGADLIYRDEASDIAILKVRRPVATLKALSLSRDAVMTGQRVYALGSPGLGDKVLAQSLSAGLVSAANRQVDGRSWIQHTAVINPGNSGGPLLSERGEILGIATLKATIDGVGFAVPSSKIRKIIGAP